MTNVSVGSNFKELDDLVISEEDEVVEEIHQPGHKKEESQK